VGVARASQLMLLNLFVAVVLNQYTRSLAISSSIVRDEHIAAFSLAWAHVDPTGSGYMPASLVYEFLIGTRRYSDAKGLRVGTGATETGP
jgi:hypothetical protein